MPSFGADMEAGTLVQWLVKPGDSIKRDQVIAIIETQKGAIDFESFADGTIHKLLIDEGDKAAVGAPIALLDDGSETPLPEEYTNPDTPNIVAARIETEATKAEALSPVFTASKNRATVIASPYARLLAAEKGIDLKLINGSGPNGAILAADITQVQPRRSETTTKDSMRSAIAAALGRAKREIPHYYLESTIDVQPAVDWLTAYNRDKGLEEQILINALFHCAVAKALLKAPELNGYYEKGVYTPASSVHLATGISIRGGGLISPAILDADQLSPDQMMEKLKDLSDRVRNGGLRSSEMSSATVTLSSLGERGADKILGIIYPPQVALIGIGKPQLRPWIVEGEVTARMVVSLSLSADHRVSDGRQGANFLNRVSKILQKPEKL